MKVIDLLNKMASNKNYKPTFLFRGSMYKYNAKTKYYEPSFMSLYKIFMILNDEVKIIEDKPKKIEKIITEESCGYTNIIDTDDDGKHLIQTNRKDRNIYISKINEIVSKLNYLLEKSDEE